ncbi:MAG: hypothetical protein ACFFAS_18340 [Promethearchaeota archaeon]
MDDLVMGITVNIILAIIEWIIVLTLISRAKKNKINTLYLLAIAIFLEGLATIFLNPGNYIFLLAFIFSDIAVWSHLLFITFTFYKDRKSPIYILLMITVPISIVHWYLSGIYDSGLNKTELFYFTVRLMYSILLFIVYGWMVYSTIKSYLKFRKNIMIQPWIKARYLLVITYCLAKISLGVFMHFVPSDSSVDYWAVGVAVSTVAALTSFIAQFLAWVMPKGFKKWLNRNFSVQKEEEILSEEELMKQLEER